MATIPTPITTADVALFIDAYRDQLQTGPNHNQMLHDLVGDAKHAAAIGEPRSAAFWLGQAVAVAEDGSAPIGACSHEDYQRRAWNWIAARTPRTVTIDLQPSRYNEAGHWRTDAVLTFADGPGRLPRRYGLGFVDPAGRSRRVQDGPVLPGPDLYVFELSVSIDNHGGTGAERQRNLTAGTEHDLRVGDSVILRTTPPDGTPAQYAYRVADAGSRWREPQLALVPADDSSNPNS